MRTFSLTGEHAAVWLAVGGAGIAVDASRRPRWRRAVVAVVTAYVHYPSDALAGVALGTAMGQLGR